MSRKQNSTTWTASPGFSPVAIHPRQLGLYVIPLLKVFSGLFGNSQLDTNIAFDRSTMPTALWAQANPYQR